MARKIWSHSQCTVTWQRKMVLAWQSSVTIARTEQKWKDMKTQVHTPEMLTRLEHVYLSWPVSPKSPHTVSSLSSTSVTARFCLVITIQTAGGCHVILLRWLTGVEHLSVISAHAGWTTHVQTPPMVVTVIRMTKCGEKTVVSWLTGQSFMSNSSSLAILVKVGLSHFREV